MRIMVCKQMFHIHCLFICFHPPGSPEYGLSWTMSGPGIDGQLCIRERMRTFVIPPPLFTHLQCHRNSTAKRSFSLFFYREYNADIVMTKYHTN